MLLLIPSIVYAVPGAKDIRISDNDGNVLNINSDGSIDISGGSTECSTSSCDLNASTTSNSQGICRADGTNCPAGNTGGWVDGGVNMYQSTTTDKVGIGTTYPSSSLGIIKQSSTAPLKISSGTSDLGDYFQINSSGNIGIGTTSTSNTLSVNGNLTFTQYAAPSAPTLASGGAGVLTGNYKYKVACYYSGNTNRYTSASAASGTITTASEQVSVTLPTCVGSNTGWKIYRTQAGGSTYNFVANTTSSPYTDNNSDASIVANVREPIQVNTASGQILVGSTTWANLGSSTNTNTGAGPNALVNISSGTQNTAFGNSAGQYIKGGSNNTAFGYSACRGNLTDQNVTGDYNDCFGRAAGQMLSTGTRNTLFGMGAGGQVTTGGHNLAFGVDSYKDDAGTYMTVFGYHAGVWDGVSGTGAATDTTAQGTHTIIIGHNAISGDTSPVSPATAILTNSIFIGDNAVATVPVTNSGCIGYGCTVTTDNSFQLGGSTAFNVGIGTHNPLKRLQVQGGDVYVNNTSAKLIMKSPDGTCSSCGPDNSDVWACSSVACP